MRIRDHFPATLLARGKRSIRRLVERRLSYTKGETALRYWQVYDYLVPKPLQGSSLAN